jgi:hypothetical protein
MNKEECMTDMIKNEEKSLKGLIFITAGFNLRTNGVNKHCLQGRTGNVQNPAFDYVELTFQAAIDGWTLSASCASLACGYENQALRASTRTQITLNSQLIPTCDD